MCLIHKKQRGKKENLKAVNSESGKFWIRMVIITWQEEQE